MHGKSQPEDVVGDPMLREPVPRRDDDADGAGSDVHGLDVDVKGLLGPW